MSNETTQSLAKHIRAQMTPEDEADLNIIIERLRHVVKRNPRLGLIAFALLSVELQD